MDLAAGAFPHNGRMDEQGLVKAVELLPGTPLPTAAPLRMLVVPPANLEELAGQLAHKVPRCGLLLQPKARYLTPGCCWMFFWGGSRGVPGVWGLAWGRVPCCICSHAPAFPRTATADN